ncbi:MAG: VCBS repeat-containing protein [Ignavibacteriales bacterium]|nr:VCBS repeat-containing protein [Ignavibacteriales bacterium]MCB9208772.1 VCBS repeat-containing protein [Ignavibacteriales bacterium]MCB9218310.1 VCBS repeat-containing protein [Ignavibacteriales bacterium]MCB9260606.1 VCBS repeat-containing protein [Ignavibacteriales bacterium]
MSKQLFIFFLALSIIQWRCSDNKIKNDKYSSLNKLEYNNPDILVDLDVGFKSVPMPMDFDGDGDYDLLISESGSYAESGVFYFENITNNQNPIFRYGMEVSSDRFRLGYDGKCFVVSEVNGSIHVLTPDRVNEKLLIYKNVPQNVFWDRNEMPLPARGYIPDTKYNIWKIIDFDGDSVYDLMSAISSVTGSYLLFFKNLQTTDNPKYAAPKKILLENGDPIGNNLSLEVPLADYDNDGDLDYLGITHLAKIIYFENIGTVQNYKYAEGIILKSNNQEIQFDCHYGAVMKPRAIDFDQDGFVDIIAGDEDGKVSYLKNTGEIIDGIPQFSPPIFFQQEAKFIDFGGLTTPRIFDWDNDGKDDIISGNGAGYIGFIKNISGNELKFDKPEYLTAKRKVIRIIPDSANWGYVTIDVGFWNKDDLPDILANDYDGNVVWFENIGTKKNPVLAEAKPILVEWEGLPQKPAWGFGKSEGNELLAQWRTSPYIMDVNNDNLNDLIMLDYEGYLAVYYRFEKDGKLFLKHPQRNFIYENDEPILLNQLKKGSSGRLKITFADWDGDGLEDLIVSSKPAVDWMKNKGKKGDKIVLEYMGRIISKTLMGHTDGPVVSDFNNDGIPDLLVGTETGAFYYWERSDINVTTTMTTSGKQKPANYKYFKR